MEFIKKSAEELKDYTAEQLKDYCIEKLTDETAKLAIEVKALEGLKEDSEEFKKKSEEVKLAHEQKMDTMLEAVKQQSIVLGKIKSGEFSASKMVSLDGSIEKALKDNAENFKSVAKSRTDFSFELDLKAVSDMTFAGNVSGGNVPQAQRLEGVNNIAERVAQTYGRIPKLTTSGNTVDWVFEDAQEGAAAGTAEGAAKNQIDNNFVVNSISLVKQTAYFKLSTEMLTEATWMAGWIRNKLIVRLFLRIDAQVLAGGGTGTDLNGLVTQATTFAAGTFANAVDNANDVDSLVVAMNQIKIANHLGGLTIFMHPSDVTALKMIKVLASATDQRYVERLAQIASSKSLDGAPIVETTAMAQGTFLVADLSKAILAEQGTIKVDVGLDGNDFTQNKRTILAEWKGEVIVENNDVSAFVNGTFATTNAALETA